MVDEIFLEDYYFDIQLFANPEDEGRTEEPTERKRRKAREEGNVAKSQDLVSAIVFIFSFWALWIMIKFIFSTMRSFMVDNFRNLDTSASYNNVGNYIMSFAMEFWKMIGPAIIVAIIVSIVANVAQVGFMFTFKPIEPKFKKILFTFRKLKEKVLFSKTVFFNFINSILKLVFLVVIFIFIIKGDVVNLINMGGMGISQSLNVIGIMILKMFNAAGIFLLAISIPDFFFKKKQFEDSLKMTREELKRELKEEEGDPLIKGYIKDMYQQLLARQNIRKTVPEADVVITNPDHYAIALKYEMESMQAPVVVAKGEDNLALMIKEIAFENDVPIVENPPLARQLFSLTEVGDYIPEDFFMVIAEILIQVGKFGARIA